MTELLAKAFAEASKLPESDQNSFALWVLAVLESERRWNDAFSGSQDLLSQLADDSLAEYRAGKTKLLDPDSL